jgi:hypothetical protein
MLPGLHKCVVTRHNKRKHRVLFRGFFNGMSVVGKCAPADALDLAVEVVQQGAVMNGGGGDAMPRSLFLGHHGASSLAKYFVDPTEFTTIFDERTLLDLIITEDFGPTLYQHAQRQDVAPQALDHQCLLALRTAFKVAQDLRDMGVAHQDLNGGNVRHDGTQFIDWETATTVQCGNLSVNGHTCGWQTDFADTTQAADVFTAVSSIASANSRLFLVGALRLWLFGKTDDNTREMSMYLCYRPYDHVTFASAIDKIDSILHAFYMP